MNTAFRSIGEYFARVLSQPVKGAPALTTNDPEALARALTPGDILLVEGNSRIAVAIRYLTQSTWSHAALYTGPLPGRVAENGEAHVMVEADVRQGVISIPLSKYSVAHTRICRPIGLTTDERQKVVDFAVARLGDQYDLRDFFDLARYFMPTPPVPTRWRRRMIALGAGDPTRAICSTLIAQAFSSVGYPILPIADIERRVCAHCDRGELDLMLSELNHIRDYALFAPRDFDISPYFAIVKPTIEQGFDFHKLSSRRDS